MALPEAKKEIAVKPGKNSITAPTIKADKEADVDRKMRLYGIINAFRQNKFPDNKQIDETLRYVVDNSPIDESKLSNDGKKLIADVRDIIETARVLVEQKNADEVFQNFLHHTIHTEASLPSADAGAVNVSKSDVAQDGRQAVEHLRTLTKLILTNAEARKLLSDASLIGRDLFARGAVKVAETARPDQEKLARVDDAAPSDQWRGPNGTTHGPNETAPELVSEADKAKAKEATEQAKEGAKVAAAEAKDAKEDVDAAPEGEATKQTLKERVLGLKDRVPQEHQDKAKEQYDKGVQFLKDEFPEERRDQWIYRLKKVLVECQKHQDYQEALTWFLSAIETYFSHGKVLASTHANKAGEQTSDPALQRAVTELRTLLERFANGQSVQPILDAGQRLQEDAKQDEGLAQWFREVDAYVRKTLLEPGFVLSPQFDGEARRLRETGEQYFDEKYKGHKDALFDSVQGWFVAWGEDPLNKRFGEDWKRLTKDLLFSADGSLAFKPHLWNDVRKVILPTLVNHVGYIPIPRIEYTDNQFDLVIENLTLEGTNLLPNIISLDAHNFLEFSPYDAIPDRNAHDFKFTFSQIQTDLRDVAFYFNKKSGLPKLKDSGLADIFLGGSGLTIKIHLADAGKDSSSVFKVKDVTVKVDSLKFSVRDTKHDILYKTLKPLAVGLVKKQISKAIEDAIRTGLEYVDEQLVAVRDQYAAARADPNTSTTQALSQLFERKAEDGAEEATQAAIAAHQKKKEKNAKFQLVSKRDSIIVPQGHEAGWINKIADRDIAAKLGDGWKSPAFNIIPGSHAPVTVPASQVAAGAPVIPVNPGTAPVPPPSHA